MPTSAKAPSVSSEKFSLIVYDKLLEIRILSVPVYISYFVRSENVDTEILSSPQPVN